MKIMNIIPHRPICDLRPPGSAAEINSRKCAELGRQLSLGPPMREKDCSLTI